ncbi:trehalose 6-phosphate phosphatase [Mycena sanguinolenta]|nr:trehalose 6-phosphate phosphatase [Mycena sanguinolenta]
MFKEVYGDETEWEYKIGRLCALEADHRAAEIPLSGRVLHVCHYLPVIATLNPAPDIKINIEGEAKDGEENAIWTLVPRCGHAAVTSGIRSLAATHEQLIIGWTGDIMSATPLASASPSADSSSSGLGAGSQAQMRVPTSVVSEVHREALGEALASYQPKEHDPDDDKTEYVPVWLDDAVAHGHYDGYCKQTLWPLFHYLLWQDVAAEASSQESQYYAHYLAANTAFASAIASVYRPGDLVWVHDYHLLLVPKLLRALVPDAVIGLFVHTPFPSSEVFRCLPRRKEILDGMVGADLVCFQTYSYSRHFTSTCIRVCGYETTLRGIDAEGHVTAVTDCLVGVDAERVGRDILRPGITPKLDALRALYEGKKIIVGRDRLDVVKGVLQKVTSPSLTDSPKLERQISKLVANINVRVFSPPRSPSPSLLASIPRFDVRRFVSLHPAIRPTLTPAPPSHQTLKKDEFYALLSVADLVVITPLRDGMNTTSMEFVIAQGRTKKSPVVLSEFMGISKHMEHVLMVNPWNLGDIAAAINEGLLMSEPEKLARHEALHKVVTTHTSHTWAAVLVKMLLGQLGGKETACRTPYIPREVLETRYHAAKKRLFFFDHDGTLAPIIKMLSMAIPPAATLTALERLSADPRNVVYIISGRDGEFLEQHLGHLKHVEFSAEHGGFMREPGQGQGTWVNLTEKLDMSWMSKMEEIFRYYTECTTGSVVEMKKSSIAWHYRASDPEWGLFQYRQHQENPDLTIVQ